MTTVADLLLRGGARLAVLTSALTLVMILAFIAYASWPALAEIGVWRFVSDGGWHPLAGRYDMAPMIVGTLLAAAGAMVLAGPLGLLAAVFRRFYAPRWLAGGFRRVVFILAALPSVVFGLWALTVIVPLIAALSPPGPSLLAAALVLAIMVLPTVAITADAALGGVPPEQIDGALSLGADRADLIWRTAVPAARRGIGGGLLLAAGRAFGETMAVVMVAGNIVQIPDSVFAPVRTLTANIALEMGYATEAHRATLFVSALVLVLLVLATAAAISLKRKS